MYVIRMYYCRYLICVGDEVSHNISSRKFWCQVRNCQGTVKVCQGIMERRESAPAGNPVSLFRQG